mmetsp:Transcript_12897/g.22627  ORF Transcript_12897/g.22627 Transcript_12897/m.22627 type:complete len:645 (-) Transcript_12897:80-2014(-)
MVQELRVHAIVQHDLLTRGRIVAIQHLGLRGDLLHLVHVHIHGVAVGVLVGRVGVLRGQHDHVVVLLDAVQSATGAHGGGLAVNLTVITAGGSRSGEEQLIGVLVGGFLVSISEVKVGEGGRSGVHDLQVAFGGVHVKLSGGTVILSRAIDHLEVRAVEEDHGVETGRVAVVAESGAVGVLRGGTQSADGVLGQGQVVVHVTVVVRGGDGGVLGGVNQLDQVRVGEGSQIPVVHISVVGGVAVAVAQALLQELGLSRRDTTQGVVLVTRNQSHHDIFADVRHHVDVLADEAVGVDGPVKSGDSLVGEQSWAVAVQELVQADLLQVTGVAGEGKGVLGVDHFTGIGDGLEGVLASRQTVAGVHPLVASHRVFGDGVVGELLEGGDHSVAVSVPGDGRGLPVLAVGIVEHDGVVAGEGHGGETGMVDLVSEVGEPDVLRIIVVQRIGAELAHALGAVGSGVATVAHATHGGILVPELVNIVEVAGSNVLDGLAGSVTRAHAVGVGGAAGSLACRAVITFKARAVAGLAVAHALVGALSVLVGGVGQDIAVQIHSGRVLLSSTERIHSVVGNNRATGAGEGTSRRIKISLGGVNVGKTELANSLRAVVGHPVAEAQTHIVSTALSVGTASIGAFSVHHRKVACKPHN